MMGVDYADKARKTYLRGKVKAFLLRYVNMSIPFTEYSYPGTMYPVIKGCTTYMNREILVKSQIQWTRTITQHVIHSIFEDTRRNEGSKAKSAAKRKEKRDLNVSLDTFISNKALLPIILN
jgi:hypothetical protein